MELVEYIYCDDRRLDSYVEQFMSPVKFDQVPSMKASVSLLGPNIEGGTTSRGRPMTRSEKVEAFTKYIVDHALVSGRSRLERSPDGVVRFFDETVEARRFVVGVENPVNLWISKSPEHESGFEFPHGPLFLIEDYRGVEQGQVTSYSGYSSLYLLIGELANRSRKRTKTPFDEFDRQDAAAERFAHDPCKFLADMGASAGPLQRIRAIYRLRAQSIDLDVGKRGATATVGYPIFIERREP